MFLQYDQNLRHAIIIAVVAFQAFVADVKALVSAGITKLCNDLDDDDTHAATLEAKTRRINLKKWLACPYPLSYLDRAYEYLLRCIIGDSTEWSFGLPNPTKEKLSIRDFAKLIVDMSHEQNPAPLAAPLSSDRSSPMIFKVAFIYMSKYVPPNSPISANMFLQNALVVAANHLHINNIPWHLAGGRGRRPRKPHFESWINLGKAADALSVTRLNSLSGSIDDAEEASQRAQASDVRAAWSAVSITLQSLPDFITRSVPPDEFSIHNVTFDKNERKNSIVLEIYQWAFTKFNMATPLHQVALLIAIYVSKIIPNLFYHEDDRPDNHDYSTMLAFTNAIRDMPWKPKDSRKGCKVAAQFITMVTVYIMAVFDRTSALHEHFDHAHSFPTAWNKKHSHKGIGSLLLIRLGVARATTGRIWKGGNLNTDWSILTRVEFANFHHKLMTMLSDREFGPWRIAQTLFGTAKARDLGLSTHTFTINPGVASTSLGKRSLSLSKIVADDNDDVEVEERHGPISKRRRH
jgi:hypothetical protein